MKLRLQITKDQDIRFISHLEYARTIERAIRRAGLPVAYSEGFNPHMKFSLASALGVGVVSKAEFVEIELAEPTSPLDAANALNDALPRGIQVLAVDAVENSAAKLMSVAGGAEYEIFLPYDKDMSTAVEKFNAATELTYEKAAPKARNKVKLIDVKKFIPAIGLTAANGVVRLHFHCKITPSGSMKAVDLLNTLNQYYALELPINKADVRRLDLYRSDEDGHIWPMLDSIYKSTK